jgi:hypothetical protein
MEFEVHPAATLFPSMTEAEFQGLKQDIKENGQREDIVVWCGKLIDGRHRLRACQELQRNPSIAELDEEQDPWKYVISHNLHRRHLTESQRGMVAAALADMKQGARTDLVPIGTKSTSIDEASDKLKVSSRTTKRAKNVIKNGCKELQQLVHDGKLSVSKAEEIATGVKCPKEQVALATEFIETPKKKPAPKQKSSGNAEVSVAMKFAENAISQLSRIRSDDPERQDAFDRVLLWMSQQ